MNEFLSILMHGRRFKAAVKELTVTELKELAAKLDKIIVEKSAAAEEEEKAHAARLIKIEELRKQMQEMGLSVEDLDAAVIKSAPKKKRAPRPPKYTIDVNGETITWTGQGRMPTVFKNEVDKGRSLDDFLI